MLDLALMAGPQDLLYVALWLEELATFGNPTRIYDSETALHAAQVLKFRHLVLLAVERRPALSDSFPRKIQTL